MFFNSTAIYSYGAARESMLKFYPYHAFLWKSIEDAIAMGFKFFDFGRVYKGDVGLADFKRRWGGQEVPLHYAYYPELPNKYYSARNNRSIQKLIQYMPFRVYKFTSELMFKHIV